MLFACFPGSSRFRSVGDLEAGRSCGCLSTGRPWGKSLTWGVSGSHFKMAQRRACEVVLRMKFNSARPGTRGALREPLASLGNCSHSLGLQPQSGWRRRSTRPAAGWRGFWGTGATFGSLLASPGKEAGQCPKLNARQIWAGCQGVLNVRFFQLQRAIQDTVSDPRPCRNSGGGCGHRDPQQREVWNSRGSE